MVGSGIATGGSGGFTSVDGRLWRLGFWRFCHARGRLSSAASGGALLMQIMTRPEQLVVCFVFEPQTAGVGLVQVPVSASVQGLPIGNSGSLIIGSGAVSRPCWQNIR